MNIVYHNNRLMEKHKNINEEILKALSLQSETRTPFTITPFQHFFRRLASGVRGGGRMCGIRTRKKENILFSYDCEMMIEYIGNPNYQ